MFFFLRHDTWTCWWHWRCGCRLLRWKGLSATAGTALAPRTSSRARTPSASPSRTAATRRTTAATGPTSGTAPTPRPAPAPPPPAPSESSAATTASASTRYVPTLFLSTSILRDPDWPNWFFSQKVDITRIEWDYSTRWEMFLNVIRSIIDAIQVASGVFGFPKFYWGLNQVSTYRFYRFCVDFYCWPNWFFLNKLI